MSQIEFIFSAYIAIQIISQQMRYVMVQGAYASDIYVLIPLRSY